MITGFRLSLIPLIILICLSLNLITLIWLSLILIRLILSLILLIKIALILKSLILLIRLSVILLIRITLIWLSLSWIIWVRNFHFFHFDTSLILNLAHHVTSFIIKKGNAYSFSSCTSCTTRSMNIRLNFFRGLNLNNKVYIWNI